MKTIDFEEWKAKGHELFGDKIEDFKFKCPNCEETQTLQEFIDNDIKDADEKFHFSCIGRWVKGRGCDWTLGGFLKIHKTEVITEDGQKHPVFEFDE
jgi:hypothetical protein